MFDYVSVIFEFNLASSLRYLSYKDDVIDDELIKLRLSHVHPLNHSLRLN